MQLRLFLALLATEISHVNSFLILGIHGANPAVRSLRQINVNLSERID